MKTLLACLLLLSAPAFADDGEDDEGGVGLIAGIDLSVYDNYYFRGYHIWEGSVSFQPSLTLGASTDYGDFTFNLWAAVPFLDRDELEAVRDEIDFTLAWEKQFADMITVGVGFYAFTNLHVPYDTEEVWATLGVDLPFNLNVGAGLYADVNQLKGIYYSLSVGYAADYFDELLSFSLDVFHGGAKYKEAEFGMPEAIGAKTSFTVNLPLGFSVGVQGLINFNKEAADAETEEGEEAPRKVTWYGGGTVSWWY